MEKKYLTIFSSKEVILNIKHSKFIGNASYVENKLKAEEFILKIKEKFKDATHNVVAYSLFCGGIMYCSDDGEPHGTAGKPVLDILKKAKIFDVCVVVTRYFGGVLLGTGGLFQAYSNCCKEVLKKASLATCILCEIFELYLDYNQLKKIEKIFSAYNVKKIKEVFLEKVFFIVAIEENSVEQFKQAILNTTNGNISIKLIGKKWQNFENY